MAKKNGKTRGKANRKSGLKFWGYRRENGRVGVRNHVVILPLDDLSNAACEAVANNSSALNCVVSLWNNRLPSGR